MLMKVAKGPGKEVKWKLNYCISFALSIIHHCCRCDELILSFKKAQCCESVMHNSTDKVMSAHLHYGVANIPWKCCAREKRSANAWVVQEISLSDCESSRFGIKPAIAVHWNLEPGSCGRSKLCRNLTRLICTCVARFHIWTRLGNLWQKHIYYCQEISSHVLQKTSLYGLDRFPILLQNIFDMAAMLCHRFPPIRISRSKIYLKANQQFDGHVKLTCNLFLIPLLS